MPTIHRIVKEALAERPLAGRDELVAVVEALWVRPVHECRMAAAEILELRRSLLEARDLALLERPIRESKTWALVDGLAASVVGPLGEQFPELGDELDRWARNDYFWIRRSALLALLLPLRRGEGDSTASPAKRTRCSRSGSSSSARRSAGSSARPAASGRTSSTRGCVLEPRVRQG